MKHKEYEFDKARDLMVKYAKPIEEAESSEVAYKLTVDLLKELKQMGLYYE